MIQYYQYLYHMSIFSNRTKVDILLYQLTDKLKNFAYSK